ncbi:MAG: MBL fold metallo-hydrolase [Pseudomonadales bacterium]|nr:MBL fold metallo-hydrolase [Pseudomonadales bacterium]
MPKPIHHTAAHLLLVVLALVALLSTQALAQDRAAASPPGPGNQIIQIKDNLYRASNGAWHSIFLVTDDGIILADPLNVAFATWLKGQLDERFKVPVKYVIYSHSHFDHVEGAAIFKPDATIIAQEGVRENMDGRYPQMPGDMIDRNHNGKFDREDIDIPTNADPGICGMSRNFFDQVDTNHDGIVPPAEFQQNIVKPDLYYRDHMILTSGGETVELMHPGKNHGNDMSVLYFPKQGVVFATDMMADALVRNDVRSLPSACGAYDGTPMNEWIRSYKAVQSLDYDTFAGGHGGFFTKADMNLPIQFLEDLKTQVEQKLSAGLSLEDMKKEMTLDKYRDWKYYDRLRVKNVEAAYLNLTTFK